MVNHDKCEDSDEIVNHSNPFGNERDPQDERGAQKQHAKPMLIYR
jgi:hypothetical protein